MHNRWHSTRHHVSAQAQDFLVRAWLWVHLELLLWKHRTQQLLVRQEGQTMAEYVVVLVIVALALVAVVTLGGTIRDKFQQVSGRIGGLDYAGN